MFLSLDITELQHDKRNYDEQQMKGQKLTKQTVEDNKQESVLDMLDNLLRSLDNDSNDGQDSEKTEPGYDCMSLRLVFAGVGAWRSELCNARLNFICVNHMIRHTNYAFD